MMPAPAAAGEGCTRTRLLPQGAQRSVWQGAGVAQMSRVAAAASWVQGHVAVQKEASETVQGQVSK